MNKNPTPMSASLFSIVLGLSGLGQGWRVTVKLWHVPDAIGEMILAAATLVWAFLLLRYIWKAVCHFHATADEFRHPVAGSTPALLGVSTVLICQAVLPYSRPLAWILCLSGLTWHLLFSVWHTGTLWKGGRQPTDAVPTLYLPSVAGNFTTAAALGALGETDWAWLFFGAGLFSWLTLESLVVQRLWHEAPLPGPQRAMLGIQFAPPVVCSSAILVVMPTIPSIYIVPLLGYGFFQLLIGLRLWSWFTKHPFGYGWWAFSFGVVSATLTCLKMALAGVTSAQALSIPVFIGANVFIGYLCIRTLGKIIEPWRTPFRRMNRPGHIDI